VLKLAPVLFFLFMYLSCTHLCTAVSSETPQRIVSLAPVLTEMIFELELGERLVGRTSYCRIPEGYGDIREVGGYLDTSIETVFSLKPDIIIALKGASLTPDKIRALGLTVHEFSNESVKDIEEAVAELGRIFDRSSLAEEKISIARNEMLRQKKSLEKLQLHDTGYVLLLDEGSGQRKLFYAASSSSFYGDILSQFGLENLLRASMPYAPVSMEGVLGLNPDIIFVLRERKSEGSEKYLKKYFPEKKIFWIYGANAQLPGIGYYMIAGHFHDALGAKGEL
jgi:iron complex transport system substrate-binding protein